LWDLEVVTSCDPGGFRFGLQDLVDRVMAVLLSQQDQGTFRYLFPKPIVLHYYFSSMRNNFSFILVASEVNGLPKAKSVVKIVEDTFR
jgi:hypothetical protein